MVYTSFSGVVVVISGDIVNNIFRFNLMVFQKFPKGFMWWIILYNHRYKLNKPDLMVIVRFLDRPLIEIYFPVLKSVETF